MRLIFIILSIFALSFANALTLKDKITKGRVGDYIVTHQQGTYTVLLIRDLTSGSLIIEEASIPEIDHDPSLSWKEWIEAKAPGHTSWTAYQIDFSSNKLSECYSYAQGNWLYTDDPNHFLTKLLSLSLVRTPQDLQKRIGPAPSSEEVDHRAFWHPPVVINGKESPKTSIVSWIGRWPKDETILSGCDVELYFGNFSFPYWIEIKTPHYMAPIRTVDSGNHLSSPMAALPKRPPLFLGPAKWANHSIQISLRCPTYYSQINLFVIDLSDDLHPTIPISATFKRGEEEQAILEVSEETMDSKLQKGHRYQWVAVPENTTNVLSESEFIFIW